MVCLVFAFVLVRIRLTKHCVCTYFASTRGTVPLSMLMFFRYGHSQVIRLLEHHMGKTGDKKGADATDGRGFLKLRRT